jgi:hypothetical protein
MYQSHGKELVTMYRPTVRYDEVYRIYVDTLFHSTSLDRNQIIRLALFTAAHSKEFYNILAKHKRRDVTSLPKAKWQRGQHRLWMEQTYNVMEERDVSRVDNRREEIVNEIINGAVGGTENRRVTSNEGRNGALSTESIAVRNQGGIKFTVN